MIQIINGNALDELKKLPDESVECVVTSPPYYGLRSYKGAETEWEDWQGQLGLELSYKMYLNHLLMVTGELKRVLKDTGTLFWNMGDSYAGKMGKRQGWNDNKMAQTREEAVENGTSIYLDADYSNIQDKSLMMIPERFVIGMIDQGWILRNKIIWRKRNGIPASVKDRFSNKWEYVFFFVKSRKYFFDLDAVRKPLKESSIRRISQNVQLQFNTGKVHDFPDDNMNMKKILIHIRQKFGANNTAGVNPGDVIEVPLDVDDFLDIPTKPHAFAHFAVYPEALIEPLIKAGCPLNGVVLDPFAGSETTGVAAERLGRNSILIEISSEYVRIISERIKDSQMKNQISPMGQEVLVL